MTVVHHDVPFFQEPPEENERLMIDSIPVMGWSCRQTDSVNLLRGDGSNTLACPWVKRLDRGGRSPFPRMT
jgi:hypothetical protein